MADQEFMSLAQKTSPTAGSNLLLVNSSEAYRIDYDKLADAMLNKLTSKNYSSLETAAKNIIAALNELNSKSLILNNTQCSKISENDDLNEYTTPGTYNCLDSATAKTLENAPYESAGFFLYVLRFGSSTFKQIAIPTVLDEIKMRTCNSGTWSAEWRQLKPIT